MKIVLAIAVFSMAVPAFAGNPYRYNPNYQPYGRQRSAKYQQPQYQTPRYQTPHYNQPSYQPRSYGYNPRARNQDLDVRSQRLGPFGQTTVHGSSGYSGRAVETDYGNGWRQWRYTDNTGNTWSGSSFDFNDNGHKWYNELAHPSSNW